LLSADLKLEARQILLYYLRRWSMEALKIGQSGAKVPGYYL
jgi:hypothetical protein